MDSATWRRVRALFEEAVELPPAARAAFLDSREPESAVRAEVEALLAADAAPEAERFASAADALAPVLAARAESAPPGTRLGSYRIVREIATGGMGTVYAAEQESPRRLVALKTVRTGFSTAEAERRFRYESEVLARLRHPGIAQIFEAGVVAGPDGRPLPFFAMEYVENAKSILEHARESRLPVSARLDLFVRVCDAVRHAHERGVIHRDLKPGNVLVDAAGQPKIIDFGVARATQADDAGGRSLVTRVGEIVGTLQYMSPEQFSGNPDDVDTLSDVYALGVLLYELLTGKQPHDLARKPITEAARIVREESPARPSAHFPALAGDLDWILLKALERDKAQRYASAFDLAEDVRRHLRHEPVSAGPPSTVYRIRKFVRRHRLAVGAAALLFLAIVAGSFGTLVGLVRARERAREATLAQATAEKEAAKKTRVNEFFRDMLRAVDPGNAGRDVLVKDVVDRAAERIEGSFAQDPEIEAEIRGTIGNVYLGLGLSREAEPHLRAAAAALEKARGAGHPETLMAANNLASVFLSTGRIEEAEAEWRRLLGIARASLGEDDIMTLDLLANLSVALRNLDRPEEAEPLCRESLERSIRVLGEADPATLTSYSNLASVLQALGRLDEAESVARRALESCRRALGEESVDTLLAMHNLASILRQRGRSDEAEPLVREAAGIARRVLGPTHPDTLTILASFLSVLRFLKSYDEAEAVARELVAGREARLGPDDPETLTGRSQLAAILRDLEKYDAASEALGDSAERMRRAVGDDDARSLEIRSVLASVRVEQGRLEEAEAEFRGALESARRRGEAADARTRVAAFGLEVGLGDCHRRMGRLEESERELLSGRAGLAATLGESHPAVLAATRRLVQLFEAAGRREDAAAWRAKLPE